MVLSLPMMSVLRLVPLTLETGCRRYKYCCPSLGFSIRKGCALANGKPPFNVEGEETNGESTASEVPPAEAEPQSSHSHRRTKYSVWQSLKLSLPVVGSRIGNAASSNGGEIKWGGILDPTPDNLLALLLTGLLGLAALQIFWQLLLVAVTITLAALKYSVIAAILLALLIVFL